MRPVKIAIWSELPDRHPAGALVGEVDLDRALELGIDYVTVAGASAPPSRRW